MPHEKLRYSLKEAARLLGISEGTLRSRINRNEIDSHTDGDRRFISARALDKYVAAAEQTAGVHAA